MPGWLSIVLIIFANAALGWLLFRLLASRSAGFDGDRLEIAFMSVTLGTAVNGWVALVLAELGIFTMVMLVAIWVGILAVTGVVLWRRSALAPASPEISRGRDEVQVDGRLTPFQLGRPVLPPWAEPLFLGLWLLAAGWLFFRPHEFILGAADAGVYVNLGAHIATDGSILIQDDLLAALDPSHYPAFLRPIQNPVASHYILPAFFVIGEPVGEITPQFYPLFPVWQAVAYSLGGVRAALLSNGLWAVLGTLGVYLFVRRLAGWEIAALAAAGLTINALQVWFARYPTTEVLSQYLLWAGLWSAAAWLSQARPHAVWATITGLALGQFFLVRIDALFIAPILALFGIWLWLRPDRPRSFWLCFGPLAMLLVHSLIHALWLSRPYFLELFDVAINLFLINWLIPAAGLVVGVLILWTAFRFRDRLSLPEPYRKSLRVAAIVAILGLSIYGWFIRPNVTAMTPTKFDPYSTATLPVPDDENLLRLGWYLSPLGVGLGIAGICLFIWRLDRNLMLPLGITAFYAVFYLWKIGANPHQVYAMRRYVPVVMPMFILAAAILIGWLADRPGRWSMPAAALLALVWLFGFGWSARGFVSQVDFQGITAQFDAFNERLRPDSVLIIDEQAPVGVGDIVGTPLKFIYGHHVLKLRDPGALDEALMVRTIEAWQNEGHSVYWIGEPDWLLRQGLTYDEATVTLSTQQLEASYDHKPRAIHPVEFPLHLLRIHAH